LKFTEGKGGKKKKDLREKRRIPQPAQRPGYIGRKKALTAFLRQEKKKKHPKKKEWLFLVEKGEFEEKI